jgi:hypothetical protein
VRRQIQTRDVAVPLSLESPLRGTQQRRPRITNRHHQATILLWSHPHQPDEATLIGYCILRWIGRWADRPTITRLAWMPPHTEAEAWSAVESVIGEPLAR